VSVGFTLASGVPTPAVGQPIDSTGSHQPIAPIDVTAATNSGTLTVNLIDTGGIGGNAPLYLVTRDQATGQAIESRLLFPARVTFASTTPLGTPLVVASTTVPTTTPVADGTLFYHQDGLGTVTELTDSNGSVAKAYAYDAYGNLLESPGTVEQPYTYTGREFDAETGLYYYRARYYDSMTGRFLQKDPIGLGGGDVNFYNYVRNNPPRLADPFGLYDIATPGEVLNFWGEFFGAISDFGANYVDMRQAWWKGADKYFHCKANCQAAQRGVEGEAVACIISDIREWWDQNVKSYWEPRSTPQDSAADQQANLYGRIQGSTNPGALCEQSCAPFRPAGLPPQY